MNVRFGIVGISLIVLLTGCATSRPVSSGNNRTSTSYGAYSEDLSAVRPTYGSSATRPVTSRPTSSSSGSVSVPTAPAPAPPRRTEPRRPVAPVASALNVNRHLDALLDTLSVQNRSIRYAPGFRIQVYVGTQRQEVESMKALIAQNFPELDPYLSYNQPTYKLKIGDFMRRTDAERYYTSVKQLIRSAQLQGDKVDVRRSLLIK